MFEKVNPAHPDKIADRIAGALVDLAYRLVPDPKIAVEVLIGHGVCHIIAETSIPLPLRCIEYEVKRIAGDVRLDYAEFPQDSVLAKNQANEPRCGDNGIFRGVPVTPEQSLMTSIARSIYARYPADGKYVFDGDFLTICQSKASNTDLEAEFPEAIIRLHQPRHRRPRLRDHRRTREGRCGDGRGHPGGALCVRGSPDRAAEEGVHPRRQPHGDGRRLG